jgi:hypothetical protein
MDSMTMEDFDELVFERTPKGYDIDYRSRRCTERLSATNSCYDRGRHGQAGCFLSRAFGREDTKKHTTVDDDFDETSMYSNGISTTPVILTDGSNSVGLFEKTNIYHVDLRKSDVF